MPALNSANSGVASKRDRLNRRPCVSRVPVAGGLGSLSERPSAMGRTRFTRQLSICQTATDDLLHPDHEAVNVIHLAVVKPERLFIDIPKQVERFDRNIRAVDATFE